MDEKREIHVGYRVLKLIYLIINAMLVIRIFRSPLSHCKNSAFSLKYKYLSIFYLRYKNDQNFKDSIYVLFSLVTLLRWWMVVIKTIGKTSSNSIFLLSKKKLPDADLISPPLPFFLSPLYPPGSYPFTQISLVSSCIYYTRIKLNLLWLLFNEV